jgi:hypothetical protein
MRSNSFAVDDELELELEGIVGMGIGSGERRIGGIISEFEVS